MDVFQLVFIFILGSAVGSFLNVLIDRLPQDKSIMGRSHCDHCKRTLQWYELLPIVSYIWQRGRSACCHKKLSIQYPAIELLTGISFVAIAYAFASVHFPSMVFTWTMILAYWGIIASCIVIFFADLKYHIIPDSMQVSLFVCALFLKLSAGLSVTSPILLLGLLESLKDGAIVMLPILFLYLITQRKGMGFGDVKLAFNIGFLLGWVGGAIALYIGFVLGAVIGVILIFTGRKKMKSMVAFGPFLIVGMVTILVGGETIVPYVKGMFNF